MCVCGGTGPSETSPDPGRLPPTTHHPCPAHSLSGFFLFLPPLCPRVISLMMCNTLKDFHQPDLLKWSMGNALGHVSSHPCSLRLSLSLCFSLSPVFLLSTFLLSTHCPEPCSLSSAFLCCLFRLHPCFLSFSPHFCCFLSPPLCGV